MSDSQRAHILPWGSLLRWDLKSAQAARFRAAHPSYRPFGEFIEEANEIVHPAEEPAHKWPVYGVNNRSGVFFQSLPARRDIQFSLQANSKGLVLSQSDTRQRRFARQSP
jgi:hypothetical protein